MAAHHLAFMVLICFLWGLNFVVAKIGMDQFPPILFTALRFGILAVMLAPFLRWHKGQMQPVLMVALLAGAVHFALTFSGLNIAGAAVSGLVAQLNVPFLTILSILFLGEVVRWRRWLGIGLAFAGVCFIGFDPALFDKIEGVSLMAVGAFSYACAVIFMRQLKNVGPMELQAWVALISAPALAAMTVTMEGGQAIAVTTADWFDWSTVLYTCIAASIIGHGGIYYLLQRYEASLTGSLTLMAPVFAVFFGVTLLDEPMTWRIAIGGAITIVGVLIIALRSGTQRTTLSQSEALAKE